MSPRLAFALETAQAAAGSTLELFGANPTVDWKADQSPVTEADRQAEQIIRDAIAQAYPDEPIFGEEQGGATDAKDRWVIDPIDGTKSFVAGTPLYSTLLSYEKDGAPVIGACIFPALSLAYWAETGAGAWRNGERIRASKESDLGRSLVCHGSIGSIIEQGFHGSMARLAERTYALRGWGDAYGHMMVADGRAGAMFDPIVEHYDISAVSLICREAGAIFTQADGAAELGRSAISAASGVHAAMLEAVNG